MPIYQLFKEENLIDTTRKEFDQKINQITFYLDSRASSSFSIDSVSKLSEAWKNICNTGIERIL